MNYTNEQIDNFKVTRLLPPGTLLTAINDDNKSVTGLVEAYRHVQYTLKDGNLDFGVEYKVRWSDGLYEWIAWAEVSTYNPTRPERPSMPSRSYSDTRSRALAGMTA